MEARTPPTWQRAGLGLYKDALGRRALSALPSQLGVIWLRGPDHCGASFPLEGDISIELNALSGAALSKVVATSYRALFST